MLIHFNVESLTVNYLIYSLLTPLVWALFSTRYHIPIVACLPHVGRLLWPYYA